ncbi:MAG: NirD/YgiW/YdeI family stress tolerance protein [Deferribacteraceae bacterium]|jgi:uncharacterized protein (TIGR00156 family)|nr:NirD/YgiW/YdeI family stress tolerance protein [Deferribacteraceae bacterium]
MVRFLFSLSLAFLFVSTAVSAQEGYAGPSAALVTVAAAKELKDDTPVIIRGKIEKFLGGEKYLFSDNSGNIVVEIDDELWRGISADQNDPVEITGEVEKDFTSVEIEASRIKKI